MQTALKLKQAKGQRGLLKALLAVVALMVLVAGPTQASTTQSKTQAVKKSVQASAPKKKEKKKKALAKKAEAAKSKQASSGETTSASTVSMTESTVLSQPTKKTSGIPAANATVSASLAKVKADEPKKTFGFSNSLSISTSTSLDVNEPTSYSGSYVLSLGAKHNPTGLSAGAKISYSREYSYERDDGTDGGFENPSFSLSKGFKSGKDFQTTLVDSVGLSLGASLPGNRESERRTFLGSIGPNVSFAKTIGRTSLSQAFGYTRLFFEYDIRDNGVVNSPDSFRSVTSLGYNLTDELSLDAALALIHSVSFQGVGRTMQSASFGVGYAATEKLSFGLGVSTDRPTLGPDGQSNLITLYDSRAASASFDLVLSF